MLNATKVIANQILHFAVATYAQTKCHIAVSVSSPRDHCFHYPRVSVLRKALLMYQTRGHLDNLPGCDAVHRYQGKGVGREKACSAGRISLYFWVQKSIFNRTDYERCVSSGRIDRENCRASSSGAAVGGPDPLKRSLSKGCHLIVTALLLCY